MHGDTGWQKFSIFFIAKGTEKFLVFANFSKRDINGETGNAGENQFTIYIDEVSLLPVDPAEKICADWEKTRNEIYNFNDRHEFLDRLVRFYRTQNKKPPIPKLSMTTIVRADTLVLPEVLFGVAKYNLQKQADWILDSFCLSLHKRLVDSIIVEGHTDSTGDRQFNSELSLQRAKAVSQYISSRAKGKDLHMTVRSWGPMRPVATNRNPAGRRKNRRVEVLLFIHE
jgi:outer membrane protein OmpA-like peptidoglycan-associated protein